MSGKVSFFFTAEYYATVCTYCSSRAVVCPAYLGGLHLVAVGSHAAVDRGAHASLWVGDVDLMSDLLWHRLLRCRVASARHIHGRSLTYNGAKMTRDKKVP